MGDDKAYKAVEVLQGCSSPANRYKYALTCVKLKRYADAERALLDQTSIRSFGMNDDFNKVPNGAAGLYLLGHVREL